MDESGRRRTVWWAGTALVLMATACGAGDDNPTAVGEASPAPLTTTAATVAGTSETAAPSTSTTTTSPTTVSAPDPCAGPTELTQDRIDRSVHLAFDRTPLDLDSDGVDDELLAYDENGEWWVTAQLPGGWAEPVDIDLPADAGVPTLVMTPDGLPAGADLDGDGGLEFFVTGRPGAPPDLLRLGRCGLQWTDLGWDDCTGPCVARIACAESGVVSESLRAIGSDGTYRWRRHRIEVVDDEAAIVSVSESEGPLDSLPDNPPAAADAGVVDC